jgi:hypothetical protein
MVARWIRGTLVLAATVVIGVASAPAQAGIIPAVYDAIFGPPGSILAGTRGFRASTGFRGFGGDCCVISAPMYGGGPCCGVGPMSYGAGFGGAFAGCNSCGVNTTFYGPVFSSAAVFSSADCCGIPGTACGLETAVATGTPTPAPQPNSASGANAGSGSSRAETSNPDDNSTFRNRPKSGETDESLRGGRGARGNFRPKTNFSDADGFVDPVAGEGAGANGAADDPTADDVIDRTKPAGDSNKKGARPADKDDGAFNGDGAGLEAQPLNLEGPVASRPSLPRRRMTMKADFGKAELVRRAAYPNSLWTSSEGTRVAAAAAARK